jgi:hypothetical protein
MSTAVRGGRLIVKDPIAALSSDWLARNKYSANLSGYCCLASPHGLAEVGNPARDLRCGCGPP